MDVFIKNVLNYSMKRFFVVSLVFAALLWLLMGGMVETFYNYINPDTTIRKVKEVSFIWKNCVAIVGFVAMWLWRWSYFRDTE